MFVFWYFAVVKFPRGWRKKIQAVAMSALQSFLSALQVLKKNGKHSPEGIDLIIEAVKKSNCGEENVWICRQNTNMNKMLAIVALVGAGGGDLQDIKSQLNLFLENLFLKDLLLKPYQKIILGKLGHGERRDLKLELLMSNHLYKLLKREMKKSGVLDPDVVTKALDECSGPGLYKVDEELYKTYMMLNNGWYKPPDRMNEPERPWFNWTDVFSGCLREKFEVATSEASSRTPSSPKSNSIKTREASSRTPSSPKSNSIKTREASSRTPTCRTKSPTLIEKARKTAATKTTRPPWN
jgi:hypothetical protein